MRIETKAYGTVEIEEKQLVTFPSGLYGFERYREYALLDAHRPPFYWLQCIEDPQLAFVLINPYVFRPDYVLDIPNADLAEIGSPVEDDILVFAIVTIPEESDELTANLQGPVVVNRNKRLGKQSISLNPQWQTKHTILRELQQHAYSGAQNE
jgi:flagellar assembly factor FliW